MSSPSQNNPPPVAPGTGRAEDLGEDDPTTEALFPSLSAPARGPRRLRLVLLLTLSLICLGTAAALYPAAAYALTTESPQQLGDLASANLRTATSHGTQWVSASGEVTSEGIAFARKGAHSGFVLTRLAARPELWLLLPTFGSAADYIPPRTFSGRLLRRDQLGLALRPVANLIDDAKGRGTDYLLIEGARPDTYLTELVAFFLLGLTGLFSLLRVTYLTRKVRAAETQPAHLTMGAV